MDYLTVNRLSLLNGFIFVSVFFHFTFLNRLPLHYVSFLLLSTPIYTLLLVCFLMNQPHYHRFFQFFVFVNF